MSKPIPRVQAPLTSENLETGDVLYRTKGLVQHAGIVIGKQQVVHNRPGTGISITSFDTYAQGKPVKVRKNRSTSSPSILQRLKTLQEQPNRYHLLINNCEHTTHFLSNGNKHSPQVRTALLSAATYALASEPLHRYQGKRMALQYRLLGSLLAGLTGLILCNASRQRDHIIEPLNEKPKTQLGILSFFRRQSTT